jgi:hypothetical protein
MATKEKYQIIEDNFISHLGFLITELSYQINIEKDQFIQKALQEGTIIDIGKTYDSHFYDMEVLNVFK